MSQREFARRLKQVMDECCAHRKQKEIAQSAGITANTLSRWRNDRYKNGPPEQIEVSHLEAVLGLPVGSLLGAASGWKRAIAQLRAVGRAAGSPPPLPTAQPAPPCSPSNGPNQRPNWIWESDADQLEERLRTVVRTAPNIVQGMVTEAGIQDIRRAVCRALTLSRESVGKPIPEVLRKICNEVQEGRFK